MAYPDICTVYCKNWKTKDCPNTSKCMIFKNKPYFTAKDREFDSLIDKFLYKRELKKICKDNNYKCKTCPYIGYKLENDYIYCRLKKEVGKWCDFTYIKN